MYKCRGFYRKIEMNIFDDSKIRLNSFFLILCFEDFFSGWRNSLKKKFRFYVARKQESKKTPNQNEQKVLDYWSLCFDTMILGNLFIHFMLPPSISSTRCLRFLHFFPREVELKERAS